jgi:hypothetical protein
MARRKRPWNEFTALACDAKLFSNQPKTRFKRIQSPSDVGGGG